ncbi:MAG TPA: polysaccharide lyase family 1 protein [Polyangiaceae bacterium]|nr:polysaccharide lyase family 1 protein [Polyangiaceae bacterium]
MAVLRGVVGPLALCLFWGCGASRDVVLGDLPFFDAALGEEGSAPDGSAGSDGNSLADTAFPEAGTDARTDARIDVPPSACPTGEAVPATSLALLSDAMGFGRLATGGAEGCVYHVTTLDDAGVGSLRDAAERVEPLWIVFDVSGDIQLASPIVLGSNKTIDGRGKAITIRTLGIVMGAGTSNVIIENLTFVGDNMGDKDAIQIADGAHTVWVDHCSLSNYGDGLIDITHGATNVTVSWCHFSMHKLVLLIGRSTTDADTDVNIRATLHHNWWDQTESYAPRLRFGKVHVLNNLIDRWRSAASACTMGGEIYSEGNVFIAKDDKVALGTSAGSDNLPGRASTLGDWLQNGATTQPREADLVFRPIDSYSYIPVRADATLQTDIMVGAGPH